MYDCLQWLRNIKKLMALQQCEEGFIKCSQ